MHTDTWSPAIVVFLLNLLGVGSHYHLDLISLLVIAVCIIILYVSFVESVVADAFDAVVQVFDNFGFVDIDTISQMVQDF
jgi:Uri superfamily endonuclease